jgi:ATPase subunit of ABC transporter with duplicated ATPase domains
VSHDRTLIDNLADETILLSGHGIYRADGGASSVWAVYDCDFESRRSRAKDIEKKIVQLQSDTRQKADWSAVSERRKIGAGSAKAHLGKLSKKMAKRSKVVQRRCEKEAERLKTTKPFIPKKVKLQFPDYEIRKLNVFSLMEVSFDYGGEQDGKSCKAPPDLLKEIGLSANTGEKMCLMGTNGAGKSTILKLIQKQLTPTGGTVYLNESVKLANIPQGLIGYFDKVRLIDNFESVPLEQSVVRQYLGSVLLRGEKVNQSVASLSSGELMRAALVKCILERAEFLLLDEPTSHLDIESIVVAEQLLAEFKGGFLMISHDRSFVTSTAEQLYYVEGGTLRLV